MIDLAEVGAFRLGPDASRRSGPVRMYLPGIGPGFEVQLLIIHNADRFTPGITRASSVQALLPPFASVRIGE